MFIPTDVEGKSFGIYTIERRIKFLEELQDKKEPESIELRMLKIERDLLLILYQNLIVHLDQVGLTYDDVLKEMDNTCVYVLSKDDDSKLKFVSENMDSLLRVYTELKSIVARIIADDK